MTEKVIKSLKKLLRNFSAKKTKKKARIAPRIGSNRKRKKAPKKKKQKQKPSKKDLPPNPVNGGGMGRKKGKGKKREKERKTAIAKRLREVLKLLITLIKLA